MYIFMFNYFYVYFYVFKFRLVQKAQKKQIKNRYFDLIANFEYYNINSSVFREFLLKLLIFLNIFIGDRGLDLLCNRPTASFNRRVEDVFTVLKFIFSS